MDTAELQALVGSSHARTFGATALRDRLRDLAQQVAELSHHRDEAHLAAEAGDVAWSLLQLDEVVARPVDKPEGRRSGRKVPLPGTSANPITQANSVLADASHLYLEDDVDTRNISSSLVRSRGRTNEHEKLVSLVPYVVWEYLQAHRLLYPDVLR